MNPIIRILLSILLLAVLGLGIVWVAVVSDYHEVTVLLLGVVWLLAAFTLSWQTERKKLKTVMLVVLVACMTVAGILAWRAGQYRGQVRAIVSRNVLVAVTQALDQYRLDSALPDCDWVCMIQQLQDSPHWTGLTIPYEERVETIRFDSIPRNDEWGCRYHYEVVTDDRFIVKSSGADRRFATGDDIEVSNQSINSVKITNIPVFPPPKKNR